MLCPRGPGVCLSVQTCVVSVCPHTRVQELFAQLKPLEKSKLGVGWWGQDELVATQGLSPHSLGVATGSSMGMENISCVTAAQCRAGRNCPPLPGPISSSWLLWMFSQNDPLCL